MVTELQGGQYSHPDLIEGPAIQPLTADGSAVALAIQLAGHHLDLFFPTPGDPPSVVAARKTERALIRRWCQEHYDSLEASASAR